MFTSEEFVANVMNSYFLSDEMILLDKCMTLGAKQIGAGLAGAGLAGAGWIGLA